MCHNTSYFTVVSIVMQMVFTASTAQHAHRKELVPRATIAQAAV